MASCTCSGSHGCCSGHGSVGQAGSGCHAGGSSSRCQGSVGCHGSAENYDGRLASLLGRHDESVALLRRAAAENDRAGAGPHAAVALVALGETLAHGGEQESARDVLQQAVKRADALAMPALAADAGRLLSATVA